MQDKEKLLIEDNKRKVNEVNELQKKIKLLSANGSSFKAEREELMQ